ADVNYYADLYDYVKVTLTGANKLVVTNPGLPYFPENFMYTPTTSPSGRQCHDVVMSFEADGREAIADDVTPAQNYLLGFAGTGTAEIPAWPSWMSAKKYPADRFFHAIMGPYTDSAQFN